MKFSAALSLAIAPLAIAKAVHNVYPVRRDGHKKGSKSAARQEGVAGGITPLVAEEVLAANGLVLGSQTEVILIWVNQGGGAATTTVNAQQTVTQTVTQIAGAGGAAGTAAAAPPAQSGAGGAVTSAVAGTGTVAAPGGGATHTVTLGGPKGIQFEPTEIKAAVGDVVIFTFLSQNHTATQSAFTTPCEPLAGGMDSGFQPNANNSVNPPPQVAMQVMVATPLWFYCRQNGHCGKGMTFSINPTADKTQSMFQAMAIAQNGQGSGSAITGNGGGGAAAAPPAEGSVTATVGATGTLAPLPGTETAVSPAATGSGGVVAGTGTLNPDGSCSCQVVCQAGSFPAVQAQGVGAFGGMPGALPSTNVAIK